MPGTNTSHRTKYRKTKIIWTGFYLRLFILFLIFLLSYGGWLLFNLNKNISKATKITNEEEKSPLDNMLILIKSTSNKDDLILKGEKDKRINILLLGIGGEEHTGRYLTDTLALVSINPETYQSAILSIPRDLYVKIPNSNYHTKINALYTYGLRNEELSPEESMQLLLQSVKNITDQDVHYYAILDFSGFKNVIETLGGINVNVENNIYDTHYPGPNYSYQTFEITKGLHHMNSDTALKYARVRHTKSGDFGRAHRQQQIIASAREKALSLRILANPLKVTTLMNALGDHLKTNITINEIPKIISLIKNINIHQATTVVLDAWDKDSLLRSSRVYLGGLPAYILLPKGKNYSQIHKLSKNIFDLNNLKENQKRIASENAAILLATADHKGFELFQKILKSWNYNTTLSYNRANYVKYCQNNTDSITSYSQKEKLFTLNNLAEQLDIKINYSKKESPLLNSPKKDIDLVLCITKNTIKYFNDEPDDVEKLDRSQKIIDDGGKVFIN